MDRGVVLGFIVMTLIGVGVGLACWSISQGMEDRKAASTYTAALCLEDHKSAGWAYAYCSDACGRTEMPARCRAYVQRWKDRMEGRR